jgi:hypothetical protein
MTVWVSPVYCRAKHSSTSGTRIADFTGRRGILSSPRELRREPAQRQDTD